MLRRYNLKDKDLDSRKFSIQQEVKRYESLWGNQTDKELLKRKLFKFRAKKNSIASGHKVFKTFDLKFGDVEMTDVCPILNINLDYYSKQQRPTAENSPSFDRLNSEKGYIVGNVFIISHKANSIKNNGTAEEHLKIAEYIDKHEKK